MENTNWFTRFNRSRAVTVVILAVVAISLLAMYFFSPLIYDDFGYSLVRHSDPAVRISDLSGLFSSAWDHYLVQNGRFANAPWCMILEWIGKPTMDFVNTGAVVALILLILNFCGWRVENRNSMLMFIAGTTFLFVPAFNETILWLCGSANYLWCAVAVFSFLTLHEKLRNGWQPNKWQIAGTMILALLAGWWHEGASLGVCFALFFYYVFHRNEISKAKIACILPFFIGTALVVFAPGTLNRGTLVSSSTTMIPGTGLGEIVAFILKTLVGVAGVVVHTVPLLIIVLIFVLLFCFKNGRERLWNFTKENLFWILAIIGSFPLLAVFGSDGRALFCLFFITLIVLVRFFQAEIQAFPRIFLGISLGFFAVAAGTYLYFIPQAYFMNEASKELVQNYKNSSTGVVAIPQILLSENSKYILALRANSFLDSEDWNSFTFVRFYGGEKFIGVPAKIYENLYENDNFFENSKGFEWKTTDDLPIFIRRAREGEVLTHANLVIELDYEKLSVIQKVKAFILEKINILKPRIQCAAPTGDNLNQESVFEWTFPSGRYFVVRKKTLLLRMPAKSIAVIEIENSETSLAEK